MFSVVVPIYNHAEFLRQAIWSALRSPLVQEILLLDDGSRDESASIAATMAAAHPDRIRDLTPTERSNRGAHARLNQLINAARYEWIAVLNSDDVFVSGRFETIAADPQFPACDLLFGNVLLIDERGRITGAQRGPSCETEPSQFECPYLEALCLENFILTTSNMIFRKTLHARIGGFRPYRYVHDWDFALRAIALGRAGYIPRYLTAYRVHGGNTIRENQRETKREIDAMLQAFREEFAVQNKNDG